MIQLQRRIILAVTLFSISSANLSLNIVRSKEGPHRISRETSSCTESEDEVSRLPEPVQGRLRFTRMAWGIDKAYVTAVYMGAPHFRRGGWGFNPLDSADPVLKDIRARVDALKARAEPQQISVAWDGGERLLDGVRVRDGTFMSPGAAALPPSAKTARFRAVWPASGAAGCPMLVLLPPNGDEDYKRRFRGLARCRPPLARAAPFV